MLELVELYELSQEPENWMQHRFECWNSDNSLDRSIGKIVTKIKVYLLIMNLLMCD